MANRCRSVSFLQLTVSLWFCLMVGTGMPKDNRCSEWRPDKNNVSTKFCLNSSKSSWMSAKNSCRESDNHLASILNLNEEEEVKSLQLRGCGDNWWIGLKLDLYWLDESPYNYSQERIKNLCVSIKNDRWEFKPCDESKCFVCKYTSYMAKSIDMTNTEYTSYIESTSLLLSIQSLGPTYPAISMSITPTPSYSGSTTNRTGRLSRMCSSLLHNEVTLTSVARSFTATPFSGLKIGRTSLQTSHNEKSWSSALTSTAIARILSFTPTPSGLKTSLQTPYNERSSLSELTSSSAPIPSSTSTRSYSQEGNSPSITRSPSTEHCVAAATSAGLVGGIVAGACVAVATVLVVLYVGCRKTKTWKPSQAKKAASRLSSVKHSDLDQISGSQNAEQHSGRQRLKADFKSNVAYATTSFQGKSTRYIMDNSIEGSHMPPKSSALYESPLMSKASELSLTSLSYEEIYWQPANSVEKLYEQFEGKRFRRIPRSEIVVQEALGAGEFGTVARGTWQGSSGGTSVAVKMLNSSSSGDRVRFLQEGAIMGQFKHKNIVSLRGLVLDGEPLMVVIELMEKGDLKTYLPTLKERTGLAKHLLKMAREIAAGMKYLAHKVFIHRDLAVRNVMLDGALTCKIGDFGMSRDITDSHYYMTQGGRIPIRWTAPEAVMYRKYSLASDVWSFGIVLYEIWTVGRRPYDDSWSNDYVVKMVDEGYRLPPPPGCAHNIYKLMIQCWHPDHHLRPTFDQIVHDLDLTDDDLLMNDSSVEMMKGMLGDDVATTAGLYLDLQNAYSGIAVVQ